MTSLVLLVLSNTNVHAQVWIGLATVRAVLHVQLLDTVHREGKAPLG